jgi:hypothetical protein
MHSTAITITIAVLDLSPRSRQEEQYQQTMPFDLDTMGDYSNGVRR